jgi:hypothetical protein
VIYCLEGPKRGGSMYGCTRSYEDAVAALDRGRRRGVSWGEIVERPLKRPPRGLRMNEWLPPFDKSR